jgi:8-oxo-dGTP diphosphatase
MASDLPDGRHQVVAAMLVRADAVLLCHRSVDREWYPDVWDLPGGHIEANETPTQALAREVREEIGVTLSDELGHRSFSLATDEFEMRVWIIRGWSGSPVNCAPEEHDEIGWFTAKDVLSMQLADSAYRPWIMEALDSEDVSPVATYREGEDADDHAQ